MNAKLIQSLSASSRRRKGIALVLAVSMIATMMVLMVAFLGVTNDGFQEAAAISGRDRSRMTGKDAILVALAQLREATEQTFASGLPKPWTSQPGAIRVHNMDGSLNTLYKLYSSDSLKATSLSQVQADVPDNWKTRPDDFVDLNEPSALPNGDMRFPIIDPRAWTTDKQTSVEGFRYLEQKGAVGPSAKGNTQQQLPMPVRWLYMLRDGTIGTLNGESLFVGASGQKATVANPIVSRFAFWVDDETCKINVNTASEGSFWDTPRADTNQERDLARTVPARLEYMRHPGHPAGVSLSSVLLPGRRLSPMGFPIPSGSSMQEMSAEDARDLWRLGRLTVAEKDESTSRGGLVAADWTKLWSLAPAESVRQARYADPMELLFDHADTSRFPGMWGQETASTQGERRKGSFFKRNPEAIGHLQKAGFFLTARSAGPETTLFGTPRVAMWPLHAQTLQNGNNLGPAYNNRDTTYNHKLMLTSMVKQRPYFVQRTDPGNGINDYWINMDGANRLLLEYLQRLTDRPFPGFDRPSPNGSTFLAKYGEDRDAILLGMLDYLRASNFADPQLETTKQFSVLCPGVEHEGFGQIAPLQMWNSKRPPTTSNHVQGLGRVLTISEVALIITCRAEVDETGKIRGEPSAINRDKLKNPGDRELDVGFLVETFLPGHGWTDYRPYANISLTGGLLGDEVSVDLTKARLPVYYLNDNALQPSSRVVSIESKELPPKAWHGAGGNLGVRGLPYGVLQFRPIVVLASEGAETQPVLRFHKDSSDANQLKIALYDSPGSSDELDLVQVVPLELPDILEDAGIPLPSLADGVGAYSLERRLARAAELGEPFLAATDVVQSLAPAHGDYRLIASQRWVESRNGEKRTPVFAPHRRWGQQAQAHTLRDQILPVDSLNQRGYISSLSYAADISPDLPDTAYFSVSALATGMASNITADSLRLDQGLRGSALPEITGDFDNGIGRAPDGPYSNRPDDGHWAAARDGHLPYFDNISQVGTSVPPVSLMAFSPQRLLPSPVMFGSIATGTRVHVPWQTLLFRPHPQHYGAQIPPDYLLLDLFWMPVLEPEPLSSNLETEGKINLNHEVLPFRHISRTTALHAAMKAEAIMAIPDEAAATYKNGGSPADRFRHHVDAEKTLALWQQEVFDRDAVFLTPGQICEQYLVPEGVSPEGSKVTRSDMEAYWSRHRLTGDNSKERPYAHLYSRLTTRSNTYRVHFIAQSLVKSRATSVQTFNSQRDRVAATFSGSALISRRLNLDHPDLPDYQTTDLAKPLDQFYRWSISDISPN